MKKILFIILSIAIISSIAVLIVTGKTGEQQTDTVQVSSASDWAKDDVNKAAALNIINADGGYNFTDAITRKEFCEIVYNYISNTLGMEDMECDASISVTDTDSKAVEQLVYRGIISGKEVQELSSTPTEGENSSSAIRCITFAPDDSLTREEAAAILQRLINNTIPVPAHELYYEFSDSDDISDWADNSVQVMCNMGVMQGVGDGKFAPKDTYTTEQAIATVIRIYEAQSASSGNLSAEYTNDFNYVVNQMMPDNENYMYSPLSVKMAFGMVANGAEGESREQLLNALGIEDLDSFNAKAKELISLYTDTDVIKLNIANSLWINEDRASERFSSAFRDLAKEYYNAEAKEVNDQNAVSEINSWASEQTSGKIPTVISDSDFEMILANALYFKGAWLNDFSKGMTQKDTFTSRDGSETEIDFMRQTDYFQYYNNNGKAVIELPYKSSQIQVDSDGNYIGSETTEADISMYLIQGEYTNHTEIIETMASTTNDKTYITLKMPKFEFEFQTSLNDILKKLGATNIFAADTAKLDAMVEGGDSYYITDSMQKTYIKVDEDGTEAAAVTIASAGATSAPKPEPIEISFDEPFTFVIYDNKNAETLFIGEYAYAK